MHWLDQLYRAILSRGRTRAAFSLLAAAALTSGCDGEPSSPDQKPEQPAIRSGGPKRLTGAAASRVKPQRKSRERAAPGTRHVRLLPFEDECFDLLVDDYDGDGRLDVAATSHAANKIKILLQTAPREFAAATDSPLVGYHPGDWVVLQQDPRLYLEFAEGLAQLITYSVSPDAQLTILSRRSEHAPRHGATFHWPGWGLGLAVVPYAQDKIFLYKKVDPLHLETAERTVVELDTFHPSLRNAERLALADIDGDGIEEIVFAGGDSHEVMAIRRPGTPGGQPKAEVLAAFPTGWQRYVLPADLNEDGQVDLVVPDSTIPNQVHLLLNDGRGRYDRRAAVDVPTGHSQNISRVAVGRDADGHDYVFSANNDGLTLFQVPRRWDGVQPPVRRHVPLSHFISLGDLELRDMDRDGVLDAVVGDGRGVWIFYGPLWGAFDELKDQPLSLY